MKEDWLKRSKNCVAQGALTNSKHPESLMFGLYPTHIKSAHKAHVWNTEDRRYIDFIGGLGTNLFGYGNDSITRAIQKHLYSGASHSLPTVHEVEAAEAIKELVPFVERVKFLKSGSSACTAAVKFARAATKRSVVLSEGYHGHDDDFVSLTSPAKGVPARDWMRTLEKPEDIDETVAAVIVEPVITDDSKDRIRFLKALRHRCTETGTLLIFDEVITGLRYEKYSVSNCYNIQPDLIVLGKALAGGMPLAAVGGPASVMDDPKVFVSTTYAGEIFSLIACKEAIRLIMHDYRYDLKHLWSMGQTFIDQFNENKAGIKIEGYPTRGVFTGEPAKIAMFFQEMGKAGVLFCKSWFFNWDLANLSEEIIYLSHEVLRRIADNSVKLSYPLPKTPFAASVRDDST